MLEMPVVWPCFPTLECNKGSFSRQQIEGEGYSPMFFQIHRLYPPTGVQATSRETKFEKERSTTGSGLKKTVIR